MNTSAYCPAGYEMPRAYDGLRDRVVSWLIGLSWHFGGKRQVRAFYLPIPTETCERCHVREKCPFPEMTKRGRMML